MRFSAVIPILLSAAAFVLGILVLLAGRNENFLTDVFIIKLDTSNIGNGTIDIPDTGISFIDNAIDSVPNSVVSAVVDSAAKRLGVADFYTAHVMGYCQGTLNATESGDDTRQITTNCTSRAMFTFDPVRILDGQLAASGVGITLDDLGFPRDTVNNAVLALNAAYKAMFITLVIGIAFAGVCILLGFLGFFESRLTACGNWIFAFLSFLSLGVAAGVGTALAIKMRDVINREIQDIGITASSSPKYLGLIWAAVAAMLIVSLYWCCACFSGRKDRRRSRDMGDEGLVDEKPVGRRRWRY